MSDVDMTDMYSSSSDDDDDDDMLNDIAAVVLGVATQFLATVVPEQPKTRHIYPRSDYTSSLWWIMLQNGRVNLPHHREHAVFRRRFGVTFARFHIIVDFAKSWKDESGNPLWSNGGDASGRPSVPLELKILGALRMVAKGCSFDAISELTGMSITCMHAFFHLFWSAFRSHLYAPWVYFPKNTAGALSSLLPYSRLGFPGAVGSVDCTHIAWARCHAMRSSQYSGRSKKPTIVYQVVCNHNRRIMHVTGGMQGTANDRLVDKYDHFTRDLQAKVILSDVSFSLYDSAGKTSTLSGAYLLSDNGYTKVRTKQCPMKVCVSMDEHFWSCQLESVRKDIECCFGILKGRYRILRTPISVQDHRTVDDIFYSCCVLHNMNLMDDELDDDSTLATELEWADTKFEGDDDDLMTIMDRIQEPAKNARSRNISG